MDAIKMSTEFTDIGILSHGRGRERCKLVCASISGLGLIFDDYLEIPCFACSGFIGYSDYLSHYEEAFLSSISYSSYPYVSFGEDIVVRMASILRSRFLEPANTLPCTTSFSLHTRIRHVDTIAPHDAAVETDPTDSFDEDGPAAKAASLFFVLELFRARGEKEKEDGNRYELDWTPADHNCSICVDDIDKPWNSLTSPCSHVFLETCLLRWLEKNHECPLCGLELPTED